MFAASKVFWFLLKPSSVIALMLLLGIALSFTCRWQRMGSRLALAGWMLLMICGLSPLANVILLPLEERIPRTVIKADQRIDGIIVLGGAENGRVSIARKALATNEAGERISETIVLARRFPNAKILLSGGAPTLFREQRSGAPALADFLVAAGIDESRIVLEETSRNTFENAAYSLKVAAPRSGEGWLLVTSAFHMPRSVGCFRRAGFDVLPWPVDYRTKDAGDMLRPFDSIAEGLRRLDIAAKEWMGLLTYAMLGRTSAVFPR